MKIKFILFTFVLCLSMGLFAQDAEKIIRVRKPNLNGHAFQTPTNISSSFVRTGLTTQLGFGFSSTVELPPIEIGDKTIQGFSGELMFMNIFLHYEQRFTDWLSLYTGFNITARIGSDISTILADGVNTVNGGEVGWKVRFLETKCLNLSGAAYAKNLSGSFINIKEYVDELLNDNPYPALSKSVPAMQAGVKLLGAYAISPTFGAQFNADLSYGESFARAKTTTYFTGGINIDADLKPSVNVPIGISAAYTHTTAPEVVMSNDGSVNILGFKLAYTGSNDYEIGAVYSRYSLKINSVKQDSDISRIQLFLKFYF